MTMEFGSQKSLEITKSNESVEIRSWVGVGFEEYTPKQQLEDSFKKEVVRWDGKIWGYGTFLLC